MASAKRFADVQTSTAWPLAVATANRQRKRHRRFDPVAVGLWVGGVALGALGCVVGATAPYHRPVAVAIGVLWWMIYLGCLGASTGALLGWVLRRSSAAPSSIPQDAPHPPRGRLDRAPTPPVSRS